jgi:WD40 repeat protein
MGRRIAFSMLMTMIVVTSVTYARQELYVEQLQVIDAFKSQVYRGAISFKSNLMGVLASDGSIKLYEVPSLKEKTAITNTPARVNALAFSVSGQTLALGASDGQAYLYNIYSGPNLKALSIHSSAITSAAFQDENWLFTSSLDKVVIVTETVSGDALGTLPTFQEDITSIALQPGAKNFAIALTSGRIQLFAIGRLELIKSLTDCKEKISSLNYSADGKYLAAGTVGGNVYVWETLAGTLKFSYSQRSWIGSVAFDSKSRWIVSAAVDSTLKFYDLKTLASVKTLTILDGYPTFATFINDETIVIGTNKGQLQRWKVAVIPPDTTNPGIVIEQPIIKDTPFKVFGSEYEIKGIVYDDSELKDVAVNGTPVLLTTIPSESSAKIPSGMKVAKRFSKVIKLDSIGINPFEITVSDKAKHTVTANCQIQRLSSEQAVEVINPVLNSETEAMSTPVQFATWFDVASYSISVNMIDIVNGQVPEFKVAGDTISDEVPLIAGYNQIQLSITSTSGDRFSKTIGINRKASILTGMIPSASSGEKKQRVTGSGPQKWAVVVGVSEYQSAGIPSLKYADKDAESFANFLRRPEGGGYDTDHMRVLLNKDATLPNVRDALINFLNQAIDMDLVVIYFAGHGAPEPARPSNMYLLTHDSDPNSLGTSAFPMWDIQTVLARYISAKKVVVFTDACHSGGISVNFATRGVGSTEQNLVNQYLADLSKTKDGIVVFTASAAGEVSQEFPEFGHGVFTYYMLEGLEGKADYNNDYTITINELMQYTEEQVKRKTRGAQNPTRSQTEYDKEMTISLIPH